MARYDEALKTKALAIAETAGAAEASRATGIPDVTIRVWLHRAKRNGGNGAKNGNGNGETKRNGVRACNDGAVELHTRTDMRGKDSMDPSLSGLTPRQARFVQEYLIDLNATQAAIRAGYSPRRADVQGHSLLRNRKVRDAIERRQKKIGKKLELTQERVIEEYMKLAFVNAKEVFTWGPNGVELKSSDDLSDDIAAAVAEVSQTNKGIRLKLHDKKGALDSLAKYLGMFVEKHEVSGPGGGPIQWVDLVKLAQAGGMAGNGDEEASSKDAGGAGSACDVSDERDNP